jgi:3D-(3,5/4)-trihydroxycyclohexane-1,2-dione acylhydrolase (decyclizing)
MCAAGTMPGALHVLWRAAQGGYHMEYGFSCMGYEIAGAMGIKMARPGARRDLHGRRRQLHDGQFRTGDGGDDGHPLYRGLTDNRGYGCINRLQKGTGGAPFNNLLDDSYHVNPSAIDFVAHAAAMGAKCCQGGTSPAWRPN